VSAYAEVLQVLTTGRQLDPADAVQLLARLRKETGEELAASVEKQLDGKYRRTQADSDAAFRKKKLYFGASMRVLQAVRRLAAAPINPFPTPRNRSTS